MGPTLDPFFGGKWRMKHVKQQYQVKQEGAIMMDEVGGVYSLPDNCRTLEIDLEGVKDLSKLSTDDYLTVTSVISLAGKEMTEKGDTFRCALTTHRQARGGYEPTEYIVTFKFEPSTIISTAAFEMLRALNNIRIHKPFLFGYDRKEDCQMVAVTISSCSNPVEILDVTIIQQKVRMYMTCENEAVHGKEREGESVKRKRTHSGSAKHE